MTGSVTVVTSQPPPSLHSGTQGEVLPDLQTDCLAFLMLLLPTAQSDAGGQCTIAVGIGGPVRGAGNVSSGNTEGMLHLFMIIIRL